MFKKKKLFKNTEPSDISWKEKPRLLTLTLLLNFQNTLPIFSSGRWISHPCGKEMDKIDLEEKQVWDYQKLCRVNHLILLKSILMYLSEERNLFTRYPLLDILVQDNFTANLSSRQKKSLISPFSLHFNKLVTNSSERSGERSLKATQHHLLSLIFHSSATFC